MVPSLLRDAMGKGVHYTADQVIQMVNLLPGFLGIRRRDLSVLALMLSGPKGVIPSPLVITATIKPSRCQFSPLAYTLIVMTLLSQLDEDVRAGYNSVFERYHDFLNLHCYRISQWGNPGFWVALARLWDSVLIYDKVDIQAEF